MKKILLLSSLVLSTAMWAQEKPIISSAVIAIDRNNDVKTAKEYIDEAEKIITGKPLSEIKSKDLAKFYFYKGKINYRVSASEDEAIQAMDSMALDKSLVGYEKLLKLEEETGRDRYTEDAQQQFQILANDIARRGIEANRAKRWKEAYDDFMKTYELKQNPAIGMTDTNMLFNAAIMAQSGEMFQESIDIYNQLIEMGYKGVTFKAVNVETGDTAIFPSKTQMDRMVKIEKFKSPMVEGDIRASLYQSLIFLYSKKENKEMYAKTIEVGRSKFPENTALLKAELQIFFDNKEYDKALANLDEAIAQDPRNVVMYYNKGVILQTELNRLAAAIEAYQSALEIDSTYSDALYMTSIIYIDSANAIGKKMNELPLNANKKYKAFEKDQKAVFAAALPYLEKARKSNPTDSQVKNALMQVYRALKMYDKAKALAAEAE
jgi:tetratricopeptide (TPR) repeat protein